MANKIDENTIDNRQADLLEADIKAHAKVTKAERGESCPSCAKRGNFLADEQREQ